MTELLKNAWDGWQQYTEGGKYAALLLLVLLFFWFRKQQEKEKALLIYTTLMVILCIFPVSAAVLMLYQTRFYDYQWIWSYVPVTMMIAYGGTIFLMEYWENYKGKNKENRRKCVGVTVAVPVLIFLCGSMGRDVFAVEEEKQERETAEEVLALITGDKEEEICLWAPQEMMAAARAFDGTIQLVYGRDMWDASLGGYSYDAYGEAEETLYLWMCRVEDIWHPGYISQTENDDAALKNILDTAGESGVNLIVLPDNILPEEIQKLEKAWGLSAIQVGEYYLMDIE